MIALWEISQLEVVFISLVIGLSGLLGSLFFMYVAKRNREKKNLIPEGDGLDGRVDDYEEESSSEETDDDTGERKTEISFLFTVGKSFLNYPAHPITILAEFNPVLDQHIKRRNYPVTLHTSRETLNAYMYHGDAGYGPYYQLKVQATERNTVEHDYHLEQQLRVKLMIFDNSCSVYLREI